MITKAEVSGPSERPEGSEAFAFGKNWRSFLGHLNAQRIAVAEESLQRMLRLSSLEGLRFLDVGSGSGLFSLAARRLGATVHSFDMDPECVACTEELRYRFFGRDADWTVDRASVLDKAYLASLGSFDIVYAWGVLHHTGSLWEALEAITIPVGDDGLLYISVYNDQGGASRRWRTVKRLYCRLPGSGRFALVAGVGLFFGARSLAVRVVRLQNPLRREGPKKGVRDRGMSRWHDLVDWVGGYPFEVAKPEEVFGFLRAGGFVLEQLSTCGGAHGCNQFVFRRAPRTSMPPS